jgi:hypothetical protein
MNKPVVELSNCDGNAFLILGKVRKAMKKQGVPQEKIDEFTKEATSGNYDHLLQTAMKYCKVE